MPISLNVSPRQLTETDFANTILTRLADWRLSPGSLVFEITETALTRDPARARTAMKELSSLGVRVCLDDFGTGPSSLQHLIAFQGQELKIDRVLIAKMASSSKELEVVRSIAGLAHALGLVVTAEGVESSREWELLEVSGCDRAQGYFYGVPMSAVDILNYLKDRGCPAGSVSASRRHAAL
jgi:EAL domain-containing protein (putative c-di-GMP-specific phosphodiesterase class I)